MAGRSFLQLIAAARQIRPIAGVVALGMLVIGAFGLPALAAVRENAPAVAQPSEQSRVAAGEDGGLILINKPGSAVASGDSAIVEALLGQWTRTSGTDCRDNYGFRRDGSQIVWSQNEDEYPRNVTVHGNRVGLDSTWRFEPSGDTLTIYDGNVRICTFARAGSAPAASPASSPVLDALMGSWTRTSGTACRESYAFRRSGNQVIWTQNQDEYTRSYSVSGNQVALDSTWRFQPEGNTLRIFNEGEQICRFRRGASSEAPATTGNASIVGDWSGDFIRTYNNPPTRSPLNITFNANGTTDQGARYTIRGDRITFMLDGIHAMEGTIRGDRITGTWTYASLRGEWEVVRDGSSAAIAPPSAAAASIAGTTWRGIVANEGREPYTITYRFNQDGSAEWRFEDTETFSAREFHRWTQTGNQIHFHFEDESGRQNYDGTISGDVMQGTKSGLLSGTFRLVRQTRAAAAASSGELSLVGSWSLRTLWSDGEVATAVFDIHPDGSFTTSQGGIGVWTQDGNRLEMRFTNGEARCAYFGTFDQKGASGDVPASPQCFGGTFTMIR